VTAAFCSAVAVALPWILAAQEPSPPQVPALERVQLTDHVFLFRAPGDLDKWTATNSVVVINDDGVLVYDTNTLPSTALMVLAGIRALTDEPVRYVINSHWHMDHWSGNEVYADSFPGVQIVATYTTRNYMARMPAPFFANMPGLEAARVRLDSALARGTFSDGEPVTEARVEAIRANHREVAVFEREIMTTRRVLPNTTYTDSLSFASGGREFRLYSMTGDAAGSTVLYLPEERILVTGDVLVRRSDGRGAQPWTMNSFAVSEWLDALRRLESFDAAIIVPGQGPALYDGEYLRTTRELYETLITQAHAALEGGAVKLTDVRSRVDLDTIRLRLTGGEADLDTAFEELVMALLGKIVQEAHDGVTAPRG
jgi:glyoxylase-like metal-dependent hydrolase (beta-lactamase superfamily II)